MSKDYTANYSQNLNTVTDNTDGVANTISNEALPDSRSYGIVTTNSNLKCYYPSKSLQSYIIIPNWNGIRTPGENFVPYPECLNYYPYRTTSFTNGVRTVNPLAKNNVNKAEEFIKKLIIPPSGFIQGQNDKYQNWGILRGNTSYKTQNVGNQVVNEMSNQSVYQYDPMFWRVTPGLSDVYKPIGFSTWSKEFHGAFLVPGMWLQNITKWQWDMLQKGIKNGNNGTYLYRSFRNESDGSLYETAQLPQPMIASNFDSNLQPGQSPSINDEFYLLDQYVPAIWSENIKYNLDYAPTKYRQNQSFMQYGEPYPFGIVQNKQLPFVSSTLVNIGYYLAPNNINQPCNDQKGNTVQQTPSGEWGILHPYGNSSDNIPDDARIFAQIKDNDSIACYCLSREACIALNLKSYNFWEYGPTGSVNSTQGTSFTGYTAWTNKYAFQTDVARCPSIIQDNTIIARTLLDPISGNEIILGDGSPYCPIQLCSHNGVIIKDSSQLPIENCLQKKTNDKYTGIELPAIGNIDTGKLGGISTNSLTQLDNNFIKELVLGNNKFNETTDLLTIFSTDGDKLFEIDSANSITLSNQAIITPSLIITDITNSDYTEDIVMNNGSIEISKDIIFKGDILNHSYNSIYHCTRSRKKDFLIRDTIKLISGEIVIDLEDYLGINENISDIYTNPMSFTNNKTSHRCTISNILDNKLIITCEDKSSNDSIEWLVIYEIN